jgi:predicted lysophospholipase L1 biosynthesis ABC-type transport system permease subunit
MIIVVTGADDLARARLLRRGFTLEYLTLGWNVAGIVVLAVAAVAARSVALTGFGLDFLIEIGASVVVIAYFPAGRSATAHSTRLKSVICRSPPSG